MDILTMMMGVIAGQSSGVEVGELLTAAMKMKVWPKRLTFPAAALQALGADNWLMHFQVDWKVTTTEANANAGFINEIQTGTGLSFIFYKTRFYGGLGSGNLPLLSKTINGVLGDETWYAGKTSVALQKIGTRHISLHVNGNPVAVFEGSGQQVVPDQPYSSSVQDFDFTNAPDFPMYNYPDGAGYDFVSFGIKKGNYSAPQLAALHNGGDFALPVDLADWECYVHAGAYEPGNVRLTDISGNNRPVYLTDFSASDLNPASPDYIFI